MCTFKTCCCFIGLRTGSLIIAYFSLVVEILFFSSGVKDVYDFTVLAAKGKAEAFELGIILFVLLVLALNLAFSIVLLVGVHQYKRGHVKAYLVYNFIFIVFLVIIFVIGLSIGSLNVITIAIAVFDILLKLYFWLVVRSYYLRMEELFGRPVIFHTA